MASQESALTWFMRVALSRGAPSAMLSFLTPFFCACSSSLRASSCSRSSISLAMRCSSRFSLQVRGSHQLHWPSRESTDALPSAHACLTTDAHVLDDLHIRLFALLLASRRCAQNHGGL